MDAERADVEVFDEVAVEFDEFIGEVEIEGSGSGDEEEGEAGAAGCAVASGDARAAGGPFRNMGEHGVEFLEPEFDADAEAAGFDDLAAGHGEDVIVLGMEDHGARVVTVGLNLNCTELGGGSGHGCFPREHEGQRRESQRWDRTSGCLPDNRSLPLDNFIDKTSCRHASVIGTAEGVH